MTQENIQKHIRLDMDEELESLTSGTKLKARYTIEKKIGAGGYGDVYRALDEEFGQRKVAVKEMTQRGMAAQELEQAAIAFKQEAYMLAGLTHQNLPSIYDYFSEHGRWYLVMSYIEGETLEKYLLRVPNGKIVPDKVIQIGIQLASVLHYLHTRNPPIIFRDLKPTNIMRTSDGQIYLIDFGIARHFKHGKARDTTALGSPGYAAPEQYGRAQTTPQTDMYSLGSTLHQLLTGHDPSDNPFQHAPLNISEYPQLNTLIMCMLERDIKKRPSSMGNIKRELQRILTGKSPVPTDTRSSLPAVVPGKMLLSQKVPAVPVPVAPQPIVKAPITVISGTQTLAWSPDGRYIALANGQIALQIIEAHTQAVLIAYQAAPGAIITGAAWSVDGRRIAAACSDGTVRVFDMVTHAQLVPYPAHSYPVETVAWSPNGKYIASADDRGLVHVWDAHTRNTISIYRQHRGLVRALSWSPDSWHILSGGSDRTAHVWHAFSRAQTFMFHLDMVQGVAWSPNGRLIAAAVSNAIYVWNALDGRPFSTYNRHKSVINDLAWSPDSQRIVTAGSDKVARIWNVLTRDTVYRYKAHTSSVISVDWSPSGSHIVSGDITGVLRIWEP